MNKRLLKISTLALAGVMLVFSCSKKEDEDVKPAATTKPATESKQEVTSSKTAVTASSTAIQNDKGNKASDNFSKYDVGFKLSSSRVSKYKKYGASGLLKSLKFAGVVSRSVKRSSVRLSNEAPDYENAKGYYEYNFDKKDFVLNTSKPNTVLVFAFPASTEDEAAKMNSAEFTFEEFDIDTKGNPLKMKASIKIGTEVVYSLNLTGTYGTDGEPTQFDYQETFGTFKQVLKISNTDAVNSLSAYFYEGETKLFGTSFTINMSGEEVSSMVTENLLGDIFVSMSIDIKGFMGEFQTLFGDPNSMPTEMSTDSGINFDTTKINGLIEKYFVIEVKEASTNAILGKGKFSTDGDIIIEYNDGTTESLDELLQSMEEAGIDGNSGFASAGLGSIFGEEDSEDDGFGDDFGDDDFSTIPGGNFDDFTTPGNNFTMPGDNFTMPGNNFTVPGDNFTVPGGNMNDFTLPGGNMESTFPGGNMGPNMRRKFY